ncbi:cysteine hydrolase [candidate division KSB1 bacterium]|nr:cysteine hydrolase [candidate division KSB1 bacterium]
MSKKALIVVDMLKDFIDANGALYCGESSRKIIPRVRELIEKHRKDGDTIIFLRDSHKEDDLEFRMFTKHCVKGTEGAKIIDELKVDHNDYQLEKSRYSGFYGTNLEKILKDERIIEVYILGVCTSICLMETVSDLRNRDVPTFVYKDAVADFDPEAHRFALKRMEKVLGAKVI